MRATLILDGLSLDDVRALILGENRIIAELSTIRSTTERMESTMSKQDDIDALGARVDAATAAVTTGVAGIRQDIADLKAANPGVDTTALEASVGRLEAEVTDVAELDSENPPAL